MKKTLVWLTSIILLIELMDTTILYSTVVPIAREFSVEPSNMSLPMLTYIVGTCLFVPLVSWLSNRCQRVNTIICMLVLFSLFSLLCGIAPGLYTFSFFRFLQGVVISVCAAMSITTLLSVCEKEDIVKIMGVINIPALFGTAIGPFLGALFSYYVSWRLAFLLNVPVCLLMAASLIYMRSSNQSRLYHEIKKESFDTSGFILMSLSLVLISAGFENLGRAISWQYILMVIAGMISCASYVLLWLLRQSRTHTEHRNSVLDLRVFTNEYFSLGIIVNIISRIAMCGLPVLLSVILQQVYGYSVLQAGSYLALIAFAGIAAKYLSSVITRFGVRNSILITSVMTAISIMLLSQLDYFIHYGYVWLLCVFLGFSMSLLYTSMNSILYIKLDESQITNASNIGSMIQQLSIGLGIVAAVGGYQWLLNHYQSADMFSGRLIGIHSYSLICIYLAILMLLNLLIDRIFYIYNWFVLTRAKNHIQSTRQNNPI